MGSVGTENYRGGIYEIGATDRTWHPFFANISPSVTDVFANIKQMTLVVDQDVAMRFNATTNDDIYLRATPGVSYNFNNFGGDISNLPYDLTEVYIKNLGANTVAEHIGTVDMSGGFDWDTTNQDFSINVDSAGATQVILISDTTGTGSRTQAVADAINSALATATITTVEAFVAPNQINVGIRALTGALGYDIILATHGSPPAGDAMAELGWTAATYDGANDGTALNMDFYIRGEIAGS